MKKDLYLILGIISTALTTIIMCVVLIQGQLAWSILIAILGYLGSATLFSMHMDIVYEDAFLKGYDVGKMHGYNQGFDRASNIALDAFDKQSRLSSSALD